MKDLSLSCLFFCLLQIATVVARCYFPNGDNVSGDFPCDQDADDSPCCSVTLGSACLSNKLCRGPDGNTVRGSCTDESWNSPDCAHYCMNADRGGTDLISCSNVTGIGTSYCCDHAVNCCDSGVGRFDVLPVEPEVWATWNRESSRFVVILQTSSKSLTSTSILPSTISSIETLASASPTPTVMVPTISLPTGGKAQTSTGPMPKPTSSQDDAQEGSELSTAAKAGIGVGTGAGALLIAAVAFLLLKVRNNKKAIQAQTAQQESHPWPGIYQGPQTQDTYYKNGPLEGWASPRPTEGKVPPDFYGSYEMDARSAERHWARVELPATT
ncbi:hypothetical protein CI238_02888 [Colletotrichum incanum]|uniref:Uncharacterized protein n=1 Tax=Colletotrichum incanum TaxID=1573173 RepID=A0A161VXW6_COLIC|nr:hypothetical protein CI238_02888 [Colletotrichum incanum]